MGTLVQTEMGMKKSWDLMEQKFREKKFRGRIGAEFCLEHQLKI